MFLKCRSTILCFTCLNNIVFAKQLAKPHSTQSSILPCYVLHCFKIESTYCKIEEDYIISNNNSCESHLGYTNNIE